MLLVPSLSRAPSKAWGGRVTREKEACFRDKKDKRCAPRGVTCVSTLARPYVRTVVLPLLLRAAYSSSTLRYQKRASIAFYVSFL